MIRLPDIYELVWPLTPGMNGEPRDAAEQVLATRRRGEAEAILGLAGERASR